MVVKFDFRINNCLFLTTKMIIAYCQKKEICSFGSGLKYFCNLSYLEN